jgi:hypothetical protein
MKLNKNYIEIRIAKLKMEPVRNANLIRKWERYLRRVV